MTPFQNLLITIIIGIFFAYFGDLLHKQGNEKAGTFFQVIAGAAIFSMPFILIWCVLHYINW